MPQLHDHGLDSESAILRKIAELEAWLKSQNIDAKKEQAHLDENSRERLYWHYGYLMGLKDSIAALANHDHVAVH